MPGAKGLAFRSKFKSEFSYSYHNIINYGMGVVDMMIELKIIAVMT
jgi:hypothetical protein